jgi:hypothetical protein
MAIEQNDRGISFVVLRMTPEEAKWTKEAFRDASLQKTMPTDLRLWYNKMHHTVEEQAALCEHMRKYEIKAPKETYDAADREPFTLTPLPAHYLDQVDRVISEDTLERNR